MKTEELLMQYICNRTIDGDTIVNIGDGEMQFNSLYNLSENYYFEDETEDILKQSISNIIDMYLDIEKKHWEELGKPDKHIYKDLLILNKLNNPSLFEE